MLRAKIIFNATGLLETYGFASKMMVYVVVQNANAIV